jgi:uncharacterized membrane protein
MGQFSATPILPLWLIVFLLCAAVAAAVIQYRLIYKRLGSKKASMIALLRLGAFSLLILFALNASLTFRKERKVPSAIAVIVDTSQSMGLPGRDGKVSRLDEARTLLTGGSTPLLTSLSETYDVKLYTLGESLRQIEKEDLSGLKAGGKGGDLGNVLKQLAGKVSLALLVSDGTLPSDGPLRGPPDSPPGGSPYSALAKDLSVITIPVGDADGYKDILISVVKAPTVAFRGRETSIDVTIRSRGYKNVTIPVMVKDGGKLLTAKNIYVGESPYSESVSFSFTPDEIGTHNISVTTPQQVGESLASNNTADLSLKVVRDKMRILMVSGSPSLNYRFIRMALKNDPSVDLLSFVILRTPSNIINVPLQEQSLIPFPVDTLFSKELKTFDLLIFDNLLFRLYLNQKHLEAIREFVRGGGAFAMIGGPNFSDDKRFANTPLAEMLPVSLQGNEDYSRGSSSGVRLTSAGAMHPVTRLSSDKTYNPKVWQEMPPLDGFNRLATKGSGTVLLESSNGPPQPILTVGTYGKGRVLTLATDYSWKWNAGMVARGRDNWAYLRFVERMVRWLTKDPSLDPVSVVLPEKAGEEGQEMELKINAGDDAARSREVVLFSVFNPEGVKVASKLKASGTAGVFVGSFRPQKKGAYRVRVETRSGSLEETIVVTGPMEGIDAAPNHGLLKTISASTGGELVSRDEDLVRVVASRTGKVKNTFIEEQEIPLWGTPYVLTLILAILGLEWYLRRRWGLV